MHDMNKSYLETFNEDKELEDAILFYQLMWLKKFESLYIIYLIKIY